MEKSATTDYPIHDLLARRWSPRALDPRPIPAEQIRSSLLILTVIKRNFTRNDSPNRVAQHDLGQAAASLTLQAEHFGLRVHQMAGIELDKARETYGIPEGHDPVTAIAIGYPGQIDTLPEGLREPERAPRERKPQSEFVFGGGWSKPAAF